MPQRPRKGDGIVIPLTKSCYSSVPGVDLLAPLAAPLGSHPCTPRCRRCARSSTRARLLHLQLDQGTCCCQGALQAAPMPSLWLGRGAAPTSAAGSPGPRVTPPCTRAAAADPAHRALPGPASTSPSQADPGRSRGTLHPSTFLLLLLLAPVVGPTRWHPRAPGSHREAGWCTE